MSSTDDHAQKVLVELLMELRPQLPRDLLLKCYKVEREHQFDRDEHVAVLQLRRLIELALDAEQSDSEFSEMESGSRK